MYLLTLMMLVWKSVSLYDLVIGCLLKMITFLGFTVLICARSGHYIRLNVYGFDIFFEIVYSNLLLQVVMFACVRACLRLSLFWG